MIKLSIEEFIFEVKEEILCYEELGEEKANLWEQGFLHWLKTSKNQKNIRLYGEDKFYCFQDETIVFDIADCFYDAVLENKIDDYWKKFS